MVILIFIAISPIKNYTVFLLIKEKYLNIKFRHFISIFNNQCSIVDYEKDNGKDIYTINSFLPLSNILDKEKEIEVYMNTNVVSIKYKYKTNKRIISIVCSKLPLSEYSGAVKKLTESLKHYSFIHEIIDFSESDFSYTVNVKIEATTKEISSKLPELIFKVGSPVKLKAENNIFSFEIRKSGLKTFNFQDFILDVSIDSNIELPFLSGLSHDTAKPVVLDLSNTLHLFINGKTGSGKSCLFNSIIQSLQFFSGDNIVFVDIDFKGNEFSQYSDFESHIFINDIEIFKNILNFIIELMNKRYRKFDKIKNIKQWNKSRSIKMPYIIINIDEVAYITLSGNKDLFEKLADIINRGRACGVIFICATQRPEATIVPTVFRNQFDSYFVGRMGRIEDNKVCGISKDIETNKFGTGEFLLSLNGNESKIQGLYINDISEDKNIVYECLSNNFESNNKVCLSKNMDLKTQLKNRVKYASPQVLSLVDEIRGAIGYRKIDNKSKIIEKQGNKKIDDLYMLFLGWIKSECTHGSKCPTLDEALEKFGEKMTAKKYRGIKEKAGKEGFLFQKTLGGIYYVCNR